jgi:hypothetical protein
MGTSMKIREIKKAADENAATASVVCGSPATGSDKPPC